MSPNPMLKVLSTFDRCRVRALLMGGQACVLYGAAEFTRDSDFVVDADEANLDRLRLALATLDARAIFVPKLSADVLLRGHACHFRCDAPAASGWHIDVMSRMRGCDEFSRLWERRRILSIPKHGPVALMDVEDLVRAKKTQRDKDWPMIARLVESDYLKHGPRPPRARIAFWLREARTLQLLDLLVRRFEGTAKRLAPSRAAIRAALANDADGVHAALIVEQTREQSLDRAFWKPLKADLSRWRRRRHRD